MNRILLTLPVVTTSVFSHAKSSNFQEAYVARAFYDYQTVLAGAKSCKWIGF